MWLKMGRARKIVPTALLLGMALGCATWTGYVLSVLWSGEWKYRELILPILAGASVTFLASVAVAVIQKGRHNARGVVWLAFLVTGSCGVAAAGLYFGVLASCALSCGTKLEREVKSPNGQSRAILCFARSLLRSDVTRFDRDRWREVRWD